MKSLLLVIILCVTAITLYGMYTDGEHTKNFCNDYHEEVAKCAGVKTLHCKAIRRLVSLDSKGCY